jgi:anthranilate phosphoribosyltransferase
MKEILNKLIHHEYLSREDAQEVLTSMAEGKYNQSQMAAFMTVYMMRSISIEELEGFRNALLQLCKAIDLKEFNPIDLCGTGGDGKDTFNISTLASFVTAGAGVKVAKHGNYGVSSRCGSSNVMEHLGIRFTNEEDFLKRSLDQAGICILHAPLFHPAMKTVAPIRKELAVKTFFNMLGPMVNPAFPNYQLVGVFDLELARLYGYLYQNTDKRFTVVHALDGYDEVSLTGSVKTITHEREGILSPSDFGLNQLSADEIKGGEEVADSAELFVKILEGEGTSPQKQVVCANAALAIQTVEGGSLLDARAKAEESLASGAALKAFKTLQNLSQKSA